MGCLRFQSLIGILVIQSLKAEERTVVRSQGIVSIPNRDFECFTALDLYYSVQVLCRVKEFPWLIHCKLYILIVILCKSNAKPECRPPPDSHGT